MTWIKTIGPSEAEGVLRSLYQRIAGPSGQVDNILRAHGLRPHTLEGHMALYKSVLHHSKNHLSRWFLEAIGVYVSRLNGCEYCDLHHRQGMRRLLKDEDRFGELDTQLHEKQPGPPFSQREQLVFPYVRDLTLKPWVLGQGSVQRLLDNGYGHGEVLEINQVTAYFAYANRVVLGLGISPQGETLGLSPNNTDDPEDWGHRHN